MIELVMWYILLKTAIKILNKRIPHDVYQYLSDEEMSLTGTHHHEMHRTNRKLSIAALHHLSVMVVIPRNN